MRKNFYRTHKILTPDQATNQLKEKTLVFASGVFDLLHIGHINFLREAKAIVQDNGSLVVVIHDDASIKKHKGAHRPINTLEDRLDFLSELDCIDFVIPWYGWEEITTFAEKLSPQYFAVTSKSYEHSKDGQWQGDSWEEIAKRIGAKIVKIEIQTNFSSSQYEKVLNDLSN